MTEDVRPPWFVVVRHGETEWSAAGRHTSTTDVELTEHGRERAARLAEFLDQWIDPEQSVVFSSPRRRALATAEVAVPGVGLHVTDLLAEVDYGGYEGLTNAEIQERRPGWELFRDGCPEGEPIEDAGAPPTGSSSWPPSSARVDRCSRSATGTSVGSSPHGSSTSTPNGAGCSTTTPARSAW